MGVFWGLGHGTTLLLLGLPLVLFNRHLPEAVQKSAEVAIGVIIMLLALRLLFRWRQGTLHFHTYEHTDKPPHRHGHSHKDVTQAHLHQHPMRRRPLSTYFIGLVHGVGGSGGITLLLLSTIPNKLEATGALLLFAVGTAASMTLLSTSLGFAIAGGSLRRNVGHMVPVLGICSAAFGIWYALGALGLIVYPL